MKRLVVTVLLLSGCRPSDGGSRSVPSSTSTASPGAVASASSGTDSARVDSLLTLADAGRIQGATTAPVWLVEISDFQCPYCKNWHDQIYPTIKREYIDRGIVRMAYVHLPLNIHRHAAAAAEASLCAAAQDKFWPLHDKLFETQERWAAMPSADAIFDSLAVATGLNATQWRGCMSSQIMRRVIAGDRTRATSTGVRSTPSFFVGDEPIAGLAPLEVYRQAIERARAKSAGRSGE